MTTLDFFRERSKLTGEPMVIGCYNCDNSSWVVMTINIADCVVIDELKCTKCGAEATVQDGVIDE